MINRPLIKNLVEIGSSGEFSQIQRVIPPEKLRAAGQMMRLHWSAWDQVESDLTTEELISLIKTLTIAEEIPGWGGGSVSPVIWLFRSLSRRTSETSDLEDWILQHTKNPYLPFGKYNYHASNREELKHFVRVAEQQRAARAEGEIRRRELAETKRELRRNEMQERAARSKASSEQRRLLVERMKSWSPQERLKFIAENKQYALEYFPSEFFTIDSRILADVAPEICSALLARVETRTEARWKRLVVAIKG